MNRTKTVQPGITDAQAPTAEGCPAVVVDWKNDLTPVPEIRYHWRAHLRTYLDMTGAERGLIVLMTMGSVIIISPASSA